MAVKNIGKGRKLVVVSVDGNSLKTCGMSTLRREFQCLAYADAVSFEKGAYHLVGKAAIKTFVERMTAEIVEASKFFNDAESVKEQADDIAFLKSLLSVKAS